MKTLPEILDGLVTTLSNISLVSGFTTEVPAGHCRQGFDALWIDDTTDSSYPKIAVVLDGAKVAQMPSYQIHKTHQFLIFLYLKQLPNQTLESLTASMSSFVSDVERAIALDSSLNGAVNNASVSGYIMDGGILFPTAAAVVTVETESV